MESFKMSLGSVFTEFRMLSLFDMSSSLSDMEFESSPVDCAYDQR